MWRLTHPRRDRGNSGNNGKQFSCSGVKLTLMGAGTPLVAYRAFFRQVQYLQTAAQNASPAEAAQLQSWHQTHIGLTAQEAAQLKDVAATHVAAMDAIEQQAAQILQAYRAQFPGKLASSASRPPPPPQLAQFQQQRDDLTLSHIQSLQASLSAGSLTKLDSWIQANFNQTTGTPSTKSHLPPQPSGGIQ